MRALRTSLLLALLVGAVLLVAGCVGRGDGRDGPGAPAARPTPTQAAGSLNAPAVKVTAQGDGGAAALQRATKAATPELQRFLARYLAVGFKPSTAVDAGELGKLFDAPLRGRVAHDLSSLSLGPGGERVSSVGVEPTADAALLARAGKPLAATVKLKVDGSAVVEEGTIPISLRATFQMVRAGAGWTIVAYDSQAKAPA